MVKQDQRVLEHAWIRERKIWRIVVPTGFMLTSEGQMPNRLTYLDWICELFSSIWIDTDLVKDVSQLINNCLELDHFMKETFSISIHNCFLASCNQFNTRLEAAVYFSHAEQKHCFTAVIENLGLSAYELVKG
jgi:hypothetical protein